MDTVETVPSSELPLAEPDIHKFASFLGFAIALLTLTVPLSVILAYSSNPGDNLYLLQSQHNTQLEAHLAELK